jgi:DNA (cytosine-5)-methyltransferase 1
VSEPLRVLDLFSGIGGFSLGLRLAGGFNTVQFVELDPWCRQVLAKNFPGTPIHDDIRTFRPAAGSADLVVGGFPCQPFSVAGKRRGRADDRDLWPEMARVIAAVRPRWVIGENVVGFVKMALDRTLSQLADIGYTCWPVVLPACAVDAPHRRERAWIVAHDAMADADGRAPERHRAPGLVAGAAREGEGERDQRQRDGHAAGGSSSAVPDALSGRPKDRQQAKSGDGPSSWRDLVERRAEPGVGGMADGLSAWLDEPADLPRVATGVAQRADRLRGLGNAVVPQVVTELGRAIMLVEALRRE